MTVSVGTFEQGRCYFWWWAMASERISRTSQNSSAPILICHFIMELVELRPYRLRDAEGREDVDYLVVPSLIGRTDEIIRAVVEVNVASSGDVEVNVAAVSTDPVSTEGGSRQSPYGSDQDFVEALANRTSVEQGEGLSRLMGWWRDLGGTLRLNKSSVNFAHPYRHNTGKSVGSVTLYENSKAELNVDSLVRWWDITDEANALQRVTDAGFPESTKWPSRMVDLSNLADWELLTAYMGWVAEVVAAANERDDPRSG